MLPETASQGSPRLASLLTALVDGLWECDLGSGRFAVHGPRLHPLLPDPPPRTIDQALDLLEPWEAAALRRGLSSFLRNPGGIYEQEVWLKVRPEALRIRAVPTSDGSVGGSIEIVQTAALLPNQFLVDSSREAIVAIDLAGRPVLINRVARQWFSIPEIGGPWWPALRQFATDKAAFDRALTDGLSEQGSLEFRLPSGLVLEAYQHDQVLRRRKLGCILRFHDVTDYHRAMRDLTTAKERLELGLVGTNDGIFDWDLRTNEVYASRVPGTPSADETEKWVHPEDRIMRDAAIRAHFERNEPYDVEFRTQVPGGTLKWFRARGTALRDADGRPYRFVGCFTDITAKREAVEALRRREREHRTVLAQIHEVVFELDSEGRLCYLNPAWTHLLGHDTQSCLRRPLLDFVDPEDRPQVQQQLRAGISSPQPLECRWIMAGGECRWLELRPGRVGDPERAPLIFGTLVDIEARRAVRAESDRARRVAEEASRTKTEFLASVSHELRTPLNVIAGAGELLQDMPLGPDARHFSEVIRSNSRMLSRLIDDLLDVSRIEAGQIDTKAQPFDPVQVLELVCEQFRGDAQSKGLCLDLTLVEAIPELLLGDADRLRQIVANLVGNAIKFTVQGRIEIRVRNRMPSGIEIFVTDTGIGMPREALERIFDKFVQLDTGGSGIRSGVGLGLAISRRLTEHMGGLLTVESTEGKGTTFCVSLPMASMEGAGLTRFPGLVGLRLAIFTADSALYDTLSLLLHRAGATALRCDGMEPLRACLNEGSCDAVLVDSDILSVPLLPEVLRLARSRDIPIAECTTGGRDPGHQLWKTLDRPLTRSRIGQFVAMAADRRHGNGAQNATVGRASSMRVLKNSPRILLVDDLSDSLEVNRALLRRSGYRVDSASAGLEAVAKTARNRYDLIFMDIEMPDFDGMEATRRIRLDAATAGRPHVPIIALTAHAAEGHRERCRESGMDDHLAKPVSAEELRAKIEQWVPPTPLVLCVFPGDPPPLSLTGFRKVIVPHAIQAVATLRELHVAAVLVAPEFAASTKLQAEANASNIPIITWNGKEPDIDEVIWTVRPTDSAPRSTIPPEIAALVPRYLDNRLRDVDAIHRALESGDFPAVQRIAHNLKGSGSGYGYSQLSALGRELERMAKTGERQRILELSAVLEQQVRQLRGALPA
jgi:two-component system, sensor histidine kinase and response regulator